MTNANTSAPPGPIPLADDAAFLLLLPIIRHAARIRFRFVRCLDRKEDLVCEAVALAFSWYCRLIARGRDPASFAVTFARLAARAAGSGRRLGGQERVGDVLSWTCQRRHGFVLAPFPDGSALIGPPFEDALADNTQSPIPAQVQFRVDFPSWMIKLPRRKRQVLDHLALGHGTQDVAAAFGLSAARVSQLRQEFRSGYLAFLSDRRPKEATPP